MIKNVFLYIWKHFLLTLNKHFKTIQKYAHILPTKFRWKLFYKLLLQFCSFFYLKKRDVPGHDCKKYDEIVFCGYGEPTLRLDIIKEVSKKIKEAGGKVRLNTNGHGNVINKRNILPELKGLIDSVSISLNADTEEAYDKIVQPLPGLRNGIYNKVKAFIEEAKKHIPEVQATIVTHQEGVDEEECEEMSKSDFDVKFRPRRYNIVG